MPVPTKYATDVAIEMEPTHLSTGSLHSQSVQTEPDNNDQTVVGALSKSSGYAYKFPCLLFKNPVHVRLHSKCMLNLTIYDFSNIVKMPV